MDVFELGILIASWRWRRFGKLEQHSVWLSFALTQYQIFLISEPIRVLHIRIGSIISLFKLYLSPRIIDYEIFFEVVCYRNFGIFFLLFRILSSSDMLRWFFSKLYCLFTFRMTNILHFNTRVNLSRMIFNLFSNSLTSFFLDFNRNGKMSHTNTYKLAHVWEEHSYKTQWKTSRIIIDFIPLHFYSYFITINFLYVFSAPFGFFLHCQQWTVTILASNCLVTAKFETSTFLLYVSRDCSTICSFLPLVMCDQHHP